MSGIDGSETRRKRRKTRAERNLSRETRQAVPKQPQEQSKQKSSKKEACPSAQHSQTTTSYTLRSGKGAAAHIPTNYKIATAGTITQDRMTTACRFLRNSKSSDWATRAPITETESVKRRVESDLKRILNIPENKNLGDGGDTCHVDTMDVAHSQHSQDDGDHCAMEVGVPALSCHSASRSQGGSSQASVGSLSKGDAQPVTSAASLSKREAHTTMSVQKHRSPASVQNKLTTPSPVNPEEFLEEEVPIQGVADKVLKEVRIKFAAMFPTRDIERELCYDLHKLVKQSSRSIGTPRPQERNEETTISFAETVLSTPLSIMPGKCMVSSTLGACRPYSRPQQQTTQNFPSLPRTPPGASLGVASYTASLPQYAEKVVARQEDRPDLLEAAVRVAELPQTTDWGDVREDRPGLRMFSGSTDTNETGDNGMFMMKPDCRPSQGHVVMEEGNVNEDSFRPRPIGSTSDNWPDTAEPIVKFEVRNPEEEDDSSGTAEDLEAARFDAFIVESREARQRQIQEEQQFCTGSHDRKSPMLLNFNPQRDDSGRLLLPNNLEPNDALHSSVQWRNPRISNILGTDSSWNVGSRSSQPFSSNCCVEPQPRWMNHQDHHKLPPLAGSSRFLSCHGGHPCAASSNYYLSASSDIIRVAEESSNPSPERVSFAKIANNFPSASSGRHSGSNPASSGGFFLKKRGSSPSSLSSAYGSGKSTRDQRRQSIFMNPHVQHSISPSGGDTGNFTGMASYQGDSNNSSSKVGSMLESMEADTTRRRSSRLSSHLVQSRYNFQVALNSACRDSSVVRVAYGAGRERGFEGGTFRGCERDSSSRRHHQHWQPFTDPHQHQVDMQRQARDFLDDLDGCSSTQQQSNTGLPQVIFGNSSDGSKNSDIFHMNL